MMNRPRSLFLCLPFFVLAIISHANEEKTFNFALIGDLPYNVKVSENSDDFNTLVEQVNDDKSLAWVLHVGDIKTGGMSCNDKTLLDRKKRFERFSPAFILTPGDNEWTDCHRVSAGSFDPLERLSKLRELFFGKEDEKLRASVDKLFYQHKLNVEFQEFRENISWQKNGVTFSTIHLVGSKNGTASFSKLSSAKRTDAHDDEVNRRNNAAMHWLDFTFQIAKSSNSPGILLAFHANPGLSPELNKNDRKPFKKFMKKLYSLSEAFPGQVIFTHGDTHYFRIDKPDFGGKKSPKNLTRVETFGDANGNWINVRVNPEAEGVFSFAPISN